MWRLTLSLVVAVWPWIPPSADAADLKVGAGAAEMQGEDSMVTAGGIGPGHLPGQEGKLRAVAIVLEKPQDEKVAIVACDVLMLTREQLDPVVAKIEKTCGIPASNVLIHTTHTHHAPSTVRVHDYGPDEVFVKRVQDAILQAVKAADDRLVDATFHFKLGEEKTVGQNSRLLLADGTIYWVGRRDDAVRPTGPFDPELPVLVFRDSAGDAVATLFGHSTHTIGTLGGDVRSPAFYGMAAQAVEADLGGRVCFLQGASGSTHNLTLTGAESKERIEKAVRLAISKAAPRDASRLASVKWPFDFKVRTFDEAAEEKAVTGYLKGRGLAHADATAAVFRQMRKELAPRRGEKRTTWLQVVLIGDVAIVGVPAELFTSLGMEIKRRSPFEDTYIVELANDWIGYLPDREGHRLGGYQVWTGLHSYAEPGTGERVVDEVVMVLKELDKGR